MKGSYMRLKDDEYEIPSKEQAVISLYQDIKFLYNYIYTVITRLI